MSATVPETLTLGGDLEVRRLGFGAMRITGPGIWGPPRDPETARRVLRRVVELGVNLIDTADSYGPEVSEELIAEALHPYPDDLVIATKGGFRRPGPNRWAADGRPERLRECCEGSLRRLRLERIDLYQLHRPDPEVPYEESVGALGELQDEGKIRHIGVSNVSLEQIARDHQATFRQAALAWLLQHSPVTLPIPGTGSVEHLEQNVAAAAIRLSEQELERLARRRIGEPRVRKTARRVKRALELRLRPRG